MKFVLLSSRRGVEADGNEYVSMETELTAEESPLPSSLQTLLGAKKFTLSSRSKWYVDKYDKAHAASFESSPKVMSNRCTIRGRSWLEELPGQPNACKVTYAVEVEVKILAFSSMLEQGLEERMRDSYSKLAGQLGAYTRTESFRERQRHR